MNTEKGAIKPPIFTAVQWQFPSRNCVCRGLHVVPTKMAGGAIIDALCHSWPVCCLNQRLSESFSSFSSQLAVEIMTFSRVTIQLNLKEASSATLVVCAAGGVCTERQLLPRARVPSSRVGTCWAWWQNTSPLPEVLGGSWQLPFKFAVACGHLVSGPVWLTAEGQRCDTAPWLAGHAGPRRTARGCSCSQPAAQGAWHGSE